MPITEPSKSHGFPYIFVEFFFSSSSLPIFCIVFCRLFCRVLSRVFFAYFFFVEFFTDFFVDFFCFYVDFFCRAFCRVFFATVKMAGRPTEGTVDKVNCVFTAFFVLYEGFLSSLTLSFNRNVYKLFVFSSSFVNSFTKEDGRRKRVSKREG